MTSKQLIVHSVFWGAVCRGPVHYKIDNNLAKPFPWETLDIRIEYLPFMYHVMFEIDSMFLTFHVITFIEFRKTNKQVKIHTITITFINYHFF